MIWLRTFQLGVKSLLLHPMRSLLTMVGILIGVWAVIVLMAFADGVSEQAQKQIEDLGAENIMIRSIKPPSEAGASFREINIYGITRAERDLLANTIPSVKNAIPIRELSLKFSYTGNPKIKPLDGRLVGCTPEYQEINKLVIDRGHFISDIEVDTNASVCVIAGMLARKLFPSEDPIKKQIYLPDKREFYEIVGVLKHRESTAAIGSSLAAQDFSTDVYIPITTMQTRMGDKEEKRGSGSFQVDHFELSQVTLQVDDLSQIGRISDLVKNTLRRNDSERQDFSITVPYDLIQRAKATRQVFLVIGVVVASFTLIVGGIGIMNIMLATVTERTREIGIRRALGAKRGDIIRQFIIETVVLSVVGGIVGIGIGMATVYMFPAAREVFGEWWPKIYEALPDEFRDMTLKVPWNTSSPVMFMLSPVPLSFGISVIIGAFFGIYPAIRAAQMDPIEALRHE